MDNDGDVGGGGGGGGGGGSIGDGGGGEQWGTLRDIFAAIVIG